MFAPVNAAFTSNIFEVCEPVLTCHSCPPLYSVSNCSCSCLEEPCNAVKLRVLCYIEGTCVYVCDDAITEHVLGQELFPNSKAVDWTSGSKQKHQHGPFLAKVNAAIMLDPKCAWSKQMLQNFKLTECCFCCLVTL